ncbi:MAG TPA: AAA family ATPase, partial [Clostridiales bacterium]|nr:AAA family ATPase [Clostridiales bacterium]
MSSKLLELKDRNAKWFDAIGTPTAASLSRLVENGGWEDLVLLCECMHERNIARIADILASFGHSKKLLLISGPSSSGKTTFAKRLSIHLRVMGLCPLVISLDTYFLNKDQSPIGPDGKPDLETID